MPRYVSLGAVPRKRHTQFRQPDGSLYAEEVIGNEGFSGISSILYHRYAPTEVTEFHATHRVAPVLLPDEALSHLHLKTWNVPASGDPVSGRVPLLANHDLTVGLCRPVESMQYYYKDADGDNLVFVHRGTGLLETQFGVLPYHEGDYLVIPRGTIYRILTESADTRLLVIESSSSIEVPHRYRNEYGQLLEHAPYHERDIRVPESLVEPGATHPVEIRIKARGQLNAFRYGHCPLEVIGWDGYLYPWAFNIADFEPITGRIHQPPTTHQTFQAQNFVVCSFVPRMLDYHPQAIPVPYNHSNIESDELLYYCNGNFGSRRGIEEGSITLHPSGLPHGPQPGAVEASLGATRTEELAVMIDTFHPLRRTAASVALEDPHYPYSWRPRS